MMKRLLSIWIICVLAALLLVACGDSTEKASDDAQPTAAGQTAEQETKPADETEAAAPTDSGVRMTDSYRAGRQAYYDITGIWMPEVEGFEAEYEADPDHGSIAFDSHGDRALFEAAKAALTQALGEPDYLNDVSAYWSKESEDGAVVQNYEVYYHEGDDGIWVFMNFFTQKDE